MTVKYAFCGKCNRSNPIEDPNKKEQTCIFCGQPFIISDEKDTQLITDSVKARSNRIPRALEQEEPIEVNLTKPMDKDNQKTLK